MIVVPDNTVLFYGDNPSSMDAVTHIIEPLRGKIKREWFVKHAYFCLPLTIGNQYGFVVKSMSTFDVEWAGGEYNDSVTVTMVEQGEHSQFQTIESHFGMGTITVQNRFVLRTPPNVNLMTINPPNYFIDGMHYMTGVIETDNLRRDFTFNLRITRPNHRIRINRGDYLGCVIPVPRGFIDGFSLSDARQHNHAADIAQEHDAIREFARRRSTEDTKKPHGNGRLYFNGEDAYGNRFPSHQKRL